MKTNIGVFFGGRSTEHEISVISASQAMAAIDRERFDVTPVYITKDGKWYTGEALLDTSNYRDVPALLKRCTQVYMRPCLGDYTLYRYNKPLFGSDKAAVLDVIIPVMHGHGGEDGSLQGVFETVGIPYAGCGILASANGMDKITMKQILQANDIPVVDYVWCTDREYFADKPSIVGKVTDKLGFPVIVKPADLGSSVGISAAHDAAQLDAAITDAARYSSRIIIEHMVEHLQEINCSVLGEPDNYRTSVLEEPVKSGEFLSYTDKYGGGSGSKGTKGAQGAKSSGSMATSQRRVPADLPADETERIRKLAGDTFRVLSCNGVSRVDVIVDRDTREIFVNEINTIPGSLSFYLWEASGITFTKLMEQLVALALRRSREAESKTLSFDQNIFAMGSLSGTKGAKGTKR